MSWYTPRLFAAFKGKPTDNHNLFFVFLFEGVPNKTHSQVGNVAQCGNQRSRYPDGRQWPEVKHLMGHDMGEMMSGAIAQGFALKAGNL